MVVNPSWACFLRAWATVIRPLTSPTSRRFIESMAFPADTSEVGLPSPNAVYLGRQLGSRSEQRCDELQMAP